MKSSRRALRTLSPVFLICCRRNNRILFGRRLALRPSPRVLACPIVVNLQES